MQRTCIELHVIGHLPSLSSQRYKIDEWTEGNGFGDKFYGKRKKKKKKKKRGKVKSKILRFFGHSNVMDVRRISRDRLLTSGEKEKDSNEEFNRIKETARAY